MYRIRACQSESYHVSKLLNLPINLNGVNFQFQYQGFVDFDTKCRQKQDDSFVFVTGCV